MIYLNICDQIVMYVKIGPQFLSFASLVFKYMPNSAGCKFGVNNDNEMIYKYNFQVVFSFWTIKTLNYKKMFFFF